MAVLDISKILREDALFSGLPDHSTVSIVENIEIINFKLGEIILQKDDPGQGYYIVHKGKVRIVDDTVEGRPVTLALLKAGVGFGERSLFFNQPVSATVRSAAKTIVLKLGREDFARLIEDDPSIGEQIHRTQERQTEYAFLKTQHLIACLSPAQTEQLVSKIERIDLNEGEQVFAEGDAPEALYLVREGNVRLIKSSLNDRLLGVRREGDAIGEMSLMNDEPRRETAIAGEGGACLMRLSVNDFKEVAGDSDAVNEAIANYARHQVLQREVILAQKDDDARDKPAEEIRVLLHRGMIKSSGLFGQNYPLSVTEQSNLAGIACLDMAARFYKRYAPTDALAEQQTISGHHDDLYSIGQKAETLGLMSRLVTLGAESIDAMATPAIYDDPESGLCVIYGITKKHLLIADPTRGLTTIRRDDFLGRWNGQALVISIAPDFGAVGKSATGLFKQFIPLFAPHKGLILRIIAITMLIQVAGIIPAFFTKILIDNVLVVGDLDLLVLLLIGLLVATLLVTMADAVKEFLQMHLMRRITATLFTRFFDHILALPITALKKWDTGSLTSRFEENQTILDTTTDGTMTIVMNSFGLIVYTPILLAMQPMLAGITLFFCFCIAGLTIANAKKMRRFEQLDFDLGAAKASHLIEVVKGINTVKALGQEDEFIERGKGFFAREMSLEYEKERFDRRLELATELLESISNILILSIGASLVIDGSMTAGSLIAFTGIASMVTGPVEELASFYDEYLEVQVALERINDILSVPREQNDGNAPCPELTGSIKFEEVSFSYDPAEGTNVLNNINLEIQPGQKVAFVGRSGSGKSTLVNMVNRLLTPTKGRVLVNGIDISTLDIVSLRKQIGVVEQMPFIFSGTVRDNITIANPSMSYEAVVSAATLAGAHDFTSFFPMRYDTRIGEGGRSLSGGQAQRLIIARALAASPKILILDEATAALDTESEKVIQKNLDKIMQDRTTLAIAHRLSTIQNADLIVVLENGEIAEKGSHEELMERKGLYHYLVSRTDDG
ncbi:MAG: peptidase domain-containing ABC transporter [Phycisphaeraceae bacterium]|nr:peptidase domain-containing ABC transporter [Phycisphaeraceae bacterium]